MSNTPVSSPPILSPAAQMITPHSPSTSSKRGRGKSAFPSIRKLFGIQISQVEVTEPSRIGRGERREEGEKRDDEVQRCDMRTVRHVHPIEVE